MSASVSSLGADSALRAASQFRFGLESAGAPQLSLGYAAYGLQGNLFEQILSLPAPLDSQYSVDNIQPSAQQPEASFERRDEPPESNESVNKNDADEEPIHEGDPSQAGLGQQPAVTAPDELPSATERVGHHSLEESIEQAGLASEREQSLVQVPDDSASETVSAEEAPVEELPPLATAAKELATSPPSLTGAEEANPLQSEASQVTLHATQFNANNATTESDGLVESTSADSKLVQTGVNQVSGEVEADKDQQTSEHAANVDGANQPSAVSHHDRRETRGRQKWYEQDVSEESFTEKAAAGDSDNGLAATKDSRVSQAVSQASASESIALAESVPQSGALPNAPTEMLANLSADKIPQTVIANAAEPTITASSESGGRGVDSPRGSAGSSPVEGIARVVEGQRTGASDIVKTKSQGDAVDLTQQERVRLVQRVARSFTRLGLEGGQIHLRLHPPQLGSLNVQVRLEGRSMTANLTTENGAARDAILESLPVLRSRLAEQGYEISQFQVEVANNGADASQNGTSQTGYEQDRRSADAQFDHGQARRGGRSSSPAEAGGSQTATQSLSWQTLSGIDVQA